MPVVRTGDSEYDKEMRKWDLPRSQGGHRPDSFEKYPQSMYKAFRNEDNGKAMCRDLAYLYSSDPVVQAKSEAFNKKCELIVRNEDEYQRARSNGWSDTQQEALDLLEAHQRDIAKAAAEAAYAVQRMSENARREYAQHDADSEEPAVDVPAPKKEGKRTRVAVA